MSSVPVIRKRGRGRRADTFGISSRSQGDHELLVPRVFTTMRLGVLGSTFDGPTFKFPSLIVLIS